jgi:RNA polymerase sigma-70 factor (ECF subfamily)
MDLEMLIKRAVNFDLDAQQQLFALFHDRMWRLCMKYVKNRTDADDLLYSSYQSFFKTLHKFRYSGEDSVMKWLAGIAYIKSQEQQRKKFRWVMLETAMTVEASIMPDVEDKIDHARLLSLVMKHKDNKYVMVFILHVIMDWEHEEISGRLLIAKNTSRNYVFRGQRHLQEQLINTKNSFI